MSIENNLKRIADALEALVALAAITGPKLETVTPSNEKPAKTEKADKVTPIKKEKPKPEPEPEPKSEDKGPTREDVRAALQSLQKQTDATVARGVLKKFKAVTLSKLDADDYEKVIAMCQDLQDE